ncbi:MAG TPA: ferritin-like domain-containing protein [Candidatus Krumholzibacteria bacterium]|nr:ferritin-like domain-containing protein [Candidatus Krumholzibacteria bacterium]
MNSLRELFVEQLRDIYSAENQLVKALPKMAKAASSSELQTAFTNHLEQTRKHVERLETIFEGLDEAPEGETCKGMAGLITEGKEAIEADGEDDVKDAWLIAAAQRVEHYEIAAYGTVKSMASLLDEEEAADLLEETLSEEKETDQHLTELSGEINPRAGGERSQELERKMKPMRRSASVSRAASPSRQSARAAGKRKR